MKHSKETVLSLKLNYLPIFRIYHVLGFCWLLVFSRCDDGRIAHRGNGGIYHRLNSWVYVHLFINNFIYFLTMSFRPKIDASTPSTIPFPLNKHSSRASRRYDDIGLRITPEENVFRKRKLSNKNQNKMS